MKLERQCPDWLTSYMDYTDNTEPLPILRRWCGVAVIAAALQRKCWFDHGRIRWYPNLYIVLVSPPGLGRKNEALTQADEFLKDPEAHINKAPRRVTLERLMEKLGTDKEG